MASWTRRQVLAALLAAAAPRRAAAGPPGAAAPSPAPGAAGDAALRLEDHQVEGDRRLAQRYVLALPSRPPGGELPVLVLLHGLGETGDARAGVHAWAERYGLLSAYARLLAPPVARTSKRKDLTDARLAELAAELARAPFRGFAVVCPFTPRVGKMPDPKAALDAYARWIKDVVLPHARKRGPLASSPERTHIGGCSMGGFVSLEVFLRHPGAFGALSGIQTAIGEARAPGYAERIAQAFAASGARPIFLETSKGDPFRKPTLRLAAELEKRGVSPEVRVSPGPHDQPWLREVGTLEALLWHDRKFHPSRRSP